MKCLLILPCLLAMSYQALAGEPWYRQALVGMEVGPTGAQWGSDPRDLDYAAHFDGAAIASKVHEIGGEYLVIWGKDGEWAYYNSKFAPKCPGMGDLDVIRDAVAAAKPLGLPVIVYCVVQQNGYVLRDHPDWEMVDHEGKKLGRICLNSGIRGHIKDLTAEMLTYGIAGFHIDMIDQGFGPPYGCWCDHCKALFQEKYQHPMPDGATWDEAWDHMLEFRYNTSADFEREVREHVRSVDSAVSVDFNYHGYPPFSFEVGQRPVQHARIGDFVTCESGVWGFSALGAGLTAEFVRAADPTNVYQVVMQRGVRFYHDQTSRPVNDMRWEMFALLAHNAQVTIVDKTPDSGVIDPVAYGRMGEVFKEVQAKRAEFGQPLLYEAGLYYSARSRDWFGRAEPEKYIQPFFGAHKSLAYAHIPAGVLLDENLSPAALAEFPVVVLCSTSYLSGGELDLLRSYVEGGGQLVVTGLTGQYDKMGQPQENPKLLELCGTRLKERITDRDNYVRFPGTEDAWARLTQEIPQDWPHLVYGAAAVLEPVTAKPFGELLRAVRRTRQREGKEGTDFPSSAGAVVGPAALLNTLGKGRVLTLACSPDAATASEYDTVEARKLLSNAVRFLNPEPAVEVDAPLNIETTITDDPESRTIRVHFVGYLAPPATTSAKRPWVIPDLVEDEPIYRATVRVRRDIKGAKAFSPGTKVAVEGNLVRVEAETIHEVVAIPY